MKVCSKHGKVKGLHVDDGFEHYIIICDKCYEDLMRKFAETRVGRGGWRYWGLKPIGKEKKGGRKIRQALKSLAVGHARGCF